MRAEFNESEEGIFTPVVMKQIQKIDEHTTLIDIGLFGVAEVAAVYLVEGERKCLIDCGSRKEAKNLIKTLKSNYLFPPDLIIATHAHYDHAQGLPAFRREAAKMGKKIEVMASSEAIPLLADANYNNCFGEGPYESITDVVSIDEGDAVDLGNLSLKIFSVPGHSKDHIAILDEKSKNLFVGDALGVLINNQTYIPPFMPPTWDPEMFPMSLKKLKELEFNKLCLGHFGCIESKEAEDLLDNAPEYLERWWQLFAANEDKLDQTGYLLEQIKKEINPSFPELTITSPKIKLLYTLMVAGRKLFGKQPQPLSEMLLLGLIDNLVSGYKVYKQTSLKSSFGML